ncbi:MAG: hypothetical protein WEA99_14910 [Brumimicrobium sp.]
MNKINSKARVFIHVTMSLDGFIAKPDEDDWDWVFKQDADDMGSRIMSEIGAVVLGNKDFRNNKVTEDGLPYGGLKVPQFVVTHNAREALSYRTIDI